MFKNHKIKIFSLLLFLISCSQKDLHNNSLVGIWNYKISNGKIYEEILITDSIVKYFSCRGENSLCGPPCCVNVKDYQNWTIEKNTIKLKIKNLPKKFEWAIYEYTLFGFDTLELYPLGGHEKEKKKFIRVKQLSLLK